MEPTSEKVTAKDTYALVTKVLDDVSKLVTQEIDLAKMEIRDQGERLRKIVILWYWITCFSFSAGLLLAAMGVLLIQNATHFPLWVCLGIPSSVFIILAVILFGVSKADFKKLDLTLKQTRRSLEECIRWKTNAPSS